MFGWSSRFYGTNQIYSYYANKIGWILNMKNNLFIHKIMNVFLKYSSFRLTHHRDISCNKTSKDGNRDKLQTYESIYVETPSSLKCLNKYIWYSTLVGRSGIVLHNDTSAYNTLMVLFKSAIYCMQHIMPITNESYFKVNVNTTK